MRAAVVLGLVLAVVPSTLVADSDRGKARAFARRLARYSWLAADGRCTRLTWTTPRIADGACGSRSMELQIVVAADVAPRLTRSGPRGEWPTICVRGAAASSLGIGGGDDAISAVEARDVVELVNAAESHVAEITRTRARCLRFAAAQREASERGEPY